MRQSNEPQAFSPTRVASRDSSARLGAAAAPASRTWVSGSGSPSSGPRGTRSRPCGFAEFVLLPSVLRHLGVWRRRLTSHNVGGAFSKLHCVFEPAPLRICLSGLLASLLVTCCCSPSALCPRSLPLREVASRACFLSAVTAVPPTWAARTLLGGSAASIAGTRADVRARAVARACLSSLWRPAR